MRIMAIGRIIILSALFVQTLSAPSGCIESCNIHHTSYQSRHTSGGYQDHADLVQGSTNLNDHDYARPGNWTEHNQYITDSGRGKIHEERGQYEEGAKKVRYYKKNFTSSYGNVNGVDARDELSGHRKYDSMRVPSNQHFDSQNIQTGQTIVQENGYHRVHSQQTQSSSARIDNRSEKLEDFGEYGYSQVNQRVPIVDTQTIETQHHIEDNPSNWSRVDSYRTDGGHGRVLEEEGQYVTGPKKVRYYKKNYTSSYSTSGVPQTNIGSTTLNELHSEMQRNLHKELDNMRREFHQTSSVGHAASATHVGSVGLAQETVGLSDLQTAESDSYRQLGGYGHIPSTGTVHPYTDQQHREMITDTRQQLPYTYPTANTHGSESQRTYESRETYTSRVHPSHQPSHLSPSYIQVPDTTHGSYQTSLHNTHSRGSSHLVDESHTRERTEVIGTHQSSAAQNQLLTESSQRAYNPSYGTYPGRQGETRHYEENWSASSHTRENLAPERTGHLTHGTADRTHYDRVAYNEHRNRYHDSHQGYDTRAHTSENNSAYRSNTGQLVTGSVNIGHAAQGADCVEESQHYQQESRYHRKYKRDDHHGRYDDSQQSQMFSQELQQVGDTQQIEDLTQQQNVGNQHLEDLTQQTQESDFTQHTSGKLEFGQQTVDSQHVEDLTQQSEQHTQQIDGEFEFGQQTVGNQQHLEDLTQQTEQFTQQTQGSDDFTQHTSGKLEFGQQTVDGQHVEDLTQQSEQHTQQIDGEFEFGQQTVGNQQHLEDLTQQTEQFTQQTQGSDGFTQHTSDKLEFGQQTVDGQHVEDLTQQSEQHTQQIDGEFEFGQQTVGNQQHLEDLTQQTEQFTQQTQGSDDFTQHTNGKLEFGQQTVDGQHVEDLTQQSEQHTQQIDSEFEFGQQTVGNQQHLEDLTQQTEQFTQQAQQSDDFTQHRSGKLELGQQTVNDQHVNNQHWADLTQQSEQHIQQKDGEFKFGQQTVGNQQHLEDLTQQTEQFTQQTQGSDDFTQHSGKLEIGQQIVDDQHVNNQHLEDLTQQNEQYTQQTEDQFELGQQTVGSRHPKDLTQKNEQFTQQTKGQFEFGQHTVDNQYSDNLTQQKKDQFTQQTQGSDDFMQQTNGKLEFGQQVQSIDKSTKPKNQYFEEFGQQNEDFTQQIGDFDKYTQQTMGQLEFEQESQRFNKPKIGNQHLEDFTQKDKDLIQQFGGLEQWQLEQMSQRADLNQDFTQQTNDQSTTGMIKPAPKPRPRQRHQKDDSTSQYIDRTHTNDDSDVIKMTEMNPLPEVGNYREGTIQRTSQYPVQYPNTNTNGRLEILNQQNQHSSMFDNEKENMDRLHWVHKSNDATVGLQWHYTYHPSDLTNIEGAQDSFYPHHNINSPQTEDLQQQSRPFNFGQQETQDQQTFEDAHLNLHDPQLSQHNEYNQRSESIQQIETSHFGNQHNQNLEETSIGVIPLQQHTQNTQHANPELDKQSQSTEQTNYKVEPRILEAFGGPYDGSRSEDIYSKVTPNPSATLPPIGGEDPWDIREKPRQFIPWVVVSTIFTPKAADVTTTEMIETTTQTIPTTTITEAPPGFWSKLGHKITNTYDKAKEKAKEYFG